METVFDWASVIIFSGLIVLFLHRSTGAERPRDHLYQYMIAAIGCAVGNYLGNAGHGVLAAMTLAAVAAFILIVLKPFRAVP